MPEQAYHQPEAHADDELIEALEPDQLVQTASKPLPPLKLGGAWEVALWALRVFVLLVSVLVVYTFVVNLPHGH